MDLLAIQKLFTESEVPEHSAASKRREVEEIKPVEHTTVVKTGVAATSGGSAKALTSSSAATAAALKKDLWAPDEVQLAADALSAPDGRARPVFDFAFAQTVEAGDVYLGLSGVTPSSIHCDMMTMKIVLPGERFKDIDLDITNERIALSAARL